MLLSGSEQKGSLHKMTLEHKLKPELKKKD